MPLMPGPLCREGFGVRLFFIMLAVSLSFACAKANRGGRVRNFEALGNLEANQSLDCVEFSSLNSSHTPADMLPGVRSCVGSERFSEAVALCAVTCVYARFDSLRVSDKSAHQAWAVLNMKTLSTLGDSDSQSFKDEILLMRDDPRSLSDLLIEFGCSDIRPITRGIWSNTE